MGDKRVAAASAGRTIDVAVSRTGPTAAVAAVGAAHVVLPAYNEEASLPGLLGRLAAVARHEELVVWIVDDGSVDDTAAVAAAGMPGLDVRLVRHARNRGLGRAVQSGIRAALAGADPDDFVVVMDADDTHDPALITALRASLDAGSDIVICSRFVEGGDDSTAPAFRRMLSRGAAVTFRRLVGFVDVHDFTSGFRAYRVDVLAQAAKHWGERLIEETGFACMVELLLKLRHFDPVVTEVPLVLQYDRKQGASKLRLRRTIGQYVTLSFVTVSPPPRNEPREVTTALVVGGGIAGLAAAHRLSRSGVAVTLLEGSDQLGGLGTFAEVGGRTVERFYHCVMPTDEHLLPLLEEVGLPNGIQWSPTTMGMVAHGRRYAFNTAVDLLRYRPLTLVQRIRFGVVSLLLRRLGARRDLDNLSTEKWLRGLYGDAVWEKMFRPLFGMKFGEALGSVPALYLWERLGRDSNVATRGYPAGGYASIIASLRAAIEAHGGTVRTGAPVAAISADGSGVRVELKSGERLTAAWGVATLPLPALHAVADPMLRAVLPESVLTYQGVVNALFVLRRPLDGHYWSPVIDSGTGFDGVVDMSSLTGQHLVYTMKYCSRESALFARSDEDIAGEWKAQLCGLYPDLIGPDDIDEVRVFRAPFVEPVYPLGYGSTKPSAEVPGTRLVLATTAQVYPDVTSWNSSTGLAHRVADGLLTRIAAEPVTTLA